MKKYAITFIIICALAGCSSGTTLNTYPEGAKVKINGKLSGITPMYYYDRAVSGHDIKVTFAKDGYNDKSVIISKDVVYIHRFFLPLPILSWPWILGYDDIYMYELEPKKN